MGGLSLNQKYPDSWRLDHPDFGDVRATTFAKGTIKEFAKISDDPLKVRSLVTVEVEGKGVSGFLPLFYHPQKQYWDNEAEGIKATDFNQAQRYFERAWMSLRAGDEVRVMLREGKPYAVVAFHDGKPRIGEDVVRCDYLSADGGVPHSFQYQFSKMRYYGEFDENKKGPDNKELYLKEEVPRIIVASESFPPFSGTWVSDDGQTRNTISSSGLIKVIYYEWRIPIGPLCYVLQVIWSDTDITNTYGKLEYKDPNGDWYTFSEDHNVYKHHRVEVLGGSMLVGLYKKDFAEQTSADLQNGPLVTFPSGPITYTIPGLPNDYSGFKRMDINNTDLLQGRAPIGWIISNGVFEIDQRLYDFIDIGLGETGLRRFMPDWSTARFYVRKHNLGT